MDLSNNDNNTNKELLQAQAQVWNYSLNYINSMSLRCAIQLGIPDIINNNNGEPMSLSKLVIALNVHPNKTDCVESLMRILVHSGFFINDADQFYCLTPFSRLLLNYHNYNKLDSAAPSNLLNASPFLLLLTDPVYPTAFHCLGTWLQNDVPTLFETAHGKMLWDHVADEPKFKSLFYDSMSTDSQLIARVVTEDCKDVFKGLESLVDVAGGTGVMAIAIAKAFPHIKCIVLDIPHVVQNLQGTTSNSNLTFLGGNMFETIPPANAVLLKWILHNWNDEDCVKILKKCKEAIPSKNEGGKVIIIDMVIGNQSEDNESMETQLLFNILMVSLFRGKERTVDDWKKLFSAAGFSDYKFTPIMGLRSLIEAYP